jgi:uncharacterized membrane protein
LTADFIYARANSDAPAADPIVAVNGEVRVPITSVQDGRLHIFSVHSGNQSFRFLIIKKPNSWGVALDACRICGAQGYRQDGQNVICRHCASAIYIPTIGEQGGCNPIGIPFHVDGPNIVVNVSTIVQSWSEVPQ